MNYLKQFQADNNLKPDGIIGRRTLSKFKEVFCFPNNSATAHFVAQTSHESLLFTRGEESFNYTPERLKEVFSFYKKHSHLANLHGRVKGVKNADFEKIANHVYWDVNRAEGYKLGNTEPTDGWKYRGRGAIMVTGRSNYEAFFKWLGLPVNSNPELLADKYFWETALWYFEVRNVWRYCTRIDFFNVKMATKEINGGTNGLGDRFVLTKKYFNLMQV